MKRINPYLTFGGNCREAMSFYRDCLGGEVVFQTVGESPLTDKMPDRMRDCILHSTLTSEAIILLGSDMVPTSGLAKGNAVSLSLECDTENEIRRFYSKLGAGGNTDYPLEETFWGALFGGLTDKFGNQWLLTFERHGDG